MKARPDWAPMQRGLLRYVVAPLKDKPFATVCERGAAHDPAIRACTTTPTAAATRRRRARFYEDFLGLPLAETLEIGETKTGRTTQSLHTFYRLDDGSYLAFFEAPDMPFEFKAQHDFDLHIALEVGPRGARADAGEGQGAAGSRRAASPTTASSTRSTSAIRTAT